jgi:hypothetical protein
VFSTGMKSVFINGVKVWDGENVTGKMAGRILKNGQN